MLTLPCSSIYSCSHWFSPPPYCSSFLPNSIVIFFFFPYFPSFRHYYLMTTQKSWLALHSIHMLQHIQIIHPTTQILKPSHIPRSKHIKAAKISRRPRVPIEGRTTAIRICPMSRHGKHIPRNPLCLSLRPPTRRPYLTKLLQPAKTETDAVAGPVPFRAREDVGARREVR